MRSTSLTYHADVGRIDFTQWAISSNNLSLNCYFPSDITTSGRYKCKIFYPDGSIYEDYSPTSYAPWNIKNQKISTFQSISTNARVPLGNGVYQWRFLVYDFDKPDIILFDSTVSVGINDIEKETIFIGEYDYTEQFNNLVENSSTLINISNGISDTVSDISAFCSQNHALLFVIMCTGLAFLIKKILKGVI